MSWSPVSATALFDVLRDGVLVVAPDDTIAYINPTIEQQVGRSAAELVGQPLESLVPGHPGTNFSRWLRRARTGAGPLRTTGYLHEMRSWFEVDAHHDDGHLVCFVTDVTERRRRDEERSLSTAIGSMLVASETWSSTVDGLAEVLRRQLRYDVAEIWSWSPRRRSLRLVSLSSDPEGSGYDEFLEVTRSHVPDGDAVMGYIAAEERLVVVRDLVTDDRIQRRAVAAACGLTTAVHTLVHVDDSTSLMVGLFRRGPVDDDTDVILERTVESIADMLGRVRSGLELERFFQLSREFVAISGLGGGFRRVNPAMVEALGYDEDVLSSSGFAAILHPDDVEPTNQVVSEMIRTGCDVEQYENRVRTADGDHRWVSWNAQLFASEGLVFSTGRDVTEERRDRIRRDAEAEVLQAVVAGEPLEVALRSVALMVERHDPSLLCSILLLEPTPDPNAAHVGVVRVAAAPSMPEAFSSAIDGLPIGPSAGSCGTAMYRRETVVVSDLMVDPLWAEYRDLAAPFGFRSAWSVPILANDREVLGSLGMYGDTEGVPTAAQIGLVEDACRLAAVAIQRSRADTALEQSDERFRLLAELITDAAFDWDLVTGTRWRNQGFFTLFGYERPEGVDLDTWWRERIHPDDLAPLLASGERAFDSDADSWVHEYRFLRADGEYADVLIRGRIVRDPSGFAIRVVGGMTDITGRRSDEREYLRAQRLESLGTLAGGISHDLNNSLTPILMAVEQLLEGEVDDETRDYLEVIAASANRSADMVRRILGFARGLEGAAATVPLAEVVRTALRLIRDLFPKDIEIVVRDEDETDCTIHGDITQLHQVLVNLALNARDAMPDGGRLTITVDEVVLDDGAIAALGQSSNGAMSEMVAGRYARITVADTGTGITASVLDRLFEPFFTTKTRAGGTGLGLATSLAIVRGHGGGMAVASEIGVGTAFTVHLPAETGSNQLGERPSRDGTTRAAPDRRATVLVVDDEPALRSVIREVLQGSGHRVIAVASGAEALRHLDDRTGNIDPVDLVVTDVMMPEMDGVQFVRELRRRETTVPVLAMTGLDDPVRMASLADEGVHVVLHKPFDRSVLLRAVATALGST